VKPEPDTVLTAEPDVEAEYPDGEKAMLEYIAHHVRYPAKAMKNEEEGKVIVEFYVENTGEITEIKIAQSVSPLLDAESIRIVKSFPKWKPARYHGIKVRSKTSLPINFKL